MSTQPAPQAASVASRERPTSSPGVPILIGVTGHRDLDPRQVEAVKEVIARTLLGIQADYPHTPLAILSPLLAGADQLVAEVALQLQRERGANLRLVAVLPWPGASSLDPDGRYGDTDTFDGLLSSADQVVTLPLREGITQADLKAGSEARDQQRDEAGRYIARHSQILLALWDGEDRPGSRTAMVIGWHQQGAPAPYFARVGELDRIDATAICHVKVRRVKIAANQRAASAGDEAVPVRWIFPEQEGTAPPPRPPRNIGERVARLIRGILLPIHHLLEVRWWFSDRSRRGERELKVRWRAIDRFNRDTTEMPQQFPGRLSTSGMYLMSAQTADSAPECVLKLRDDYALADVAAGTFQGNTRTTTLILFAIAFSAVACLEVYAHFWHEWPLLAAYLALLGVGWSLFRWMRSTEQQGRWLDYRALAEALRVQIYWRAGGLSDCVADYYLRHFQGDLDWVRHAVRALFLMSGGHSTDPPQSLSEEIQRLQGMQQDWIHDQHKFFQKKAPDNTQLEISFETVTRLAFLGAVLVAVYHLWYHLATGHMSHALVLATFGCLLLAAFVEEFADLQTYSILSRRYGWMAHLYGAAGGRLDAIFQSDSPTPTDVERARTILFEVGQEALAENSEWVVQHRQRPPTLPRG